jgi:hypothetical protein
MSIQAAADLILKLYDLRRETEMRKAREWFFREFNPKSFDEVKAALVGDHSGHLRMVLSYWDMAAALVNHGAISVELFNDANGEHLATFARIEPFIADWRAAFAPQFMVNVEKLVDATPDGRKRIGRIQEMMKRFPAGPPSKQAPSTT